MERWNRICRSVLKHKDKNSKEDIFQTEMEYIFEYVLGWSDDEIVPQKRNKVFSANAYIPDIIIENNNNNLIVVELKRPNISIETHREQLFHYMRLKYSQVGLLIGDKLQVFCEIPINSNPPKLILDIDFFKDNPEGVTFIKLFSKDSFNIKSIENFAQKKIDEIEEKKIKIEIIDFLSSSEGNQYILNIVLKNLIEKYSLKIIEELESDISDLLNPQNKSSISNAITIQTLVTNSKPIVTNKVLPKKRTENGLLIGKFVQFSFRKAFQLGLISESEINDLQKPEYSKRIFNSNFEILKNKNRDISDDSGIKRYYAKELFCENYYLTAQWIEPQWDLLLNWLKKIGYDYKKQ